MLKECVWLEGWIVDLEKFLSIVMVMRDVVKLWMIYVFLCG